MVFSICTATLLYQAVEFYKRFHAYPTRININKMPFFKMDKFLAPAATVCYESYSRTKFCEEIPDLCRVPENKEEFCENNPQFCSTNSTDAMPTLDEWIELLDMIAFEILLSNDSFYLPFVHTDKQDGLKSTFTMTSMFRYAKCYSKNLHIFDKEKESFLNPDDLKSISLPDPLFSFEVDLNLREKFYNPLEEPNVYFALHSPFEPFQPISTGEIFQPGFRYVVQIESLEEERLLPPPYETNCVDYKEQWKKNNKTGPLSQKLCLEMCIISYLKECGGCEFGFTMYESLKTHCSVVDLLSLSEKCGSENVDYNFYSKKSSCISNCGSECIKQKYKYKVEKISKKTRSIRQIPNGYEYFETIDISVFLQNPEVFRLTHIPLYSDEDLFSYIGGLMGCWLGISIWSFTGIFQRFFKRMFRWKKKFNAQRKERHL